jgi:hypothetical protein
MVQAVERLRKSIPNVRLIYHISIISTYNCLGLSYVHENPLTTIRDSRCYQKQKSLHSAKAFATLELQLSITERKLYIKDDTAMTDSSKSLTRVSATTKEMCDNIAVLNIICVTSSYHQEKSHKLYFTF